jgi:uncharacterized membrane protein
MNTFLFILYCVGFCLAGAVATTICALRPIKDKVWTIAFILLMALVWPVLVALALRRIWKRKA